MADQMDEKGKKPKKDKDEFIADVLERFRVLCRGRIVRTDSGRRGLEVSERRRPVGQPGKERP